MCNLLFIPTRTRTILGRWKVSLQDGNYPHRMEIILAGWKLSMRDGNNPRRMHEKLWNSKLCSIIAILMRVKIRHSGTIFLCPCIVLLSVIWPKINTHLSTILFMFWMLDKSNIEITIHYYQDGKKFRFMLKSKRHIFHPAQARNPPGKKMLSSFLSQCTYTCGNGFHQERVR